MNGAVVMAPNDNRHFTVKLDPNFTVTNNIKIYGFPN